MGLPLVTVLIGIPLIAIGALMIWGSPTIVLNTAGQDKNSSEGWPWHRAAAVQFVEAVRNQMVSE
jgi:hypothetical protein